MPKRPSSPAPAGKTPFDPPKPEFGRSDRADTWSAKLPKGARVVPKRKLLLPGKSGRR